MRKTSLSISLFILFYLFFYAFYCVNSFAQSIPSKGITKLPTPLYSQPDLKSMITMHLLEDQQVDIKKTSPDGKFFYIEIDMRGPNEFGWVKADDIKITDYDFN